MNITIFWSVIALFYFALSIVTLIALRKLKRDFSRLDDISPSGIFNDKGKVVAVETTLYKALKAILITDILGFLVAAAAAIVPLIY